jgi:hypothetical protein
MEKLKVKDQMEDICVLEKDTEMDHNVVMRLLQSLGSE